MQKMIHKFQLNSINCATMPRGKIPAIWFCVPFSILRTPCAKKFFLERYLGAAEKVCWWGEESVAGRGRERQKARVWNYTREGLSPFPDGLSKR
jgi:hypothetical protein